MDTISVLLRIFRDSYAFRTASSSKKHGISFIPTQGDNNHNLWVVFDFPSTMPGRRMVGQSRRATIGRHLRLNVHGVVPILHGAFLTHACPSNVSVPPLGKFQKQHPIWVSGD